MNDYNLYLDDIREPVDSYLDTKIDLYINIKWKIVRSYVDFVNCITNYGIPNIISLDHDLSFEHYNNNINYDSYKYKTGYHCTKWLVEYINNNIDSIKLPELILIHSMNINGSENMVKYLNDNLIDNKVEIYNIIYKFN